LIIITLICYKHNIAQMSRKGGEKMAHRVETASKEVKVVKLEEAVIVAFSNHMEPFSDGRFSVSLDVLRLALERQGISFEDSELSEAIDSLVSQRRFIKVTYLQSLS